jgi:transglutaminase-like putative cysteine protease
VGVWRNVSGTKYASAFSQDLSVTLASETSPFLYPNQYVNFSQGDASMQAVTTITKNSKTDLDAINNIYQYVVDNISYDDHKAATVQPGYLPNNTSTLSTKTGICFDYASLTCAMLREERIPAKLVVGYAKQAYHSWIEVYSTKTGTVQKYSFNGKGWVLMDPTFDSTSKGTADVTALVGDGHSYQPIYYY